MKELLKTISDTARLMVGVGSYENYVKHMQENHPDAVMMNEGEYFRYCVDARYPSDKNRNLKRCPC